MTVEFPPKGEPHPLAGLPEPEPQPKKRKKRKLPKVVSAAEAQSLLDAIRNDQRQDVGVRARNELAVLLMYRAGLRVSEVCAVTSRDIEADGIIRLYDAKGGDGTAYFDPDTILPKLDEWAKWRRYWGVPDGGPLFVWQDGRPCNTRYFQRLVKQHKEELGIRGIVTPHVFRHSFATELLEEGLSLVEVQAALRHANLGTTEVYLHVRDESLRRKMTQRGRKGVTT